MYLCVIVYNVSHFPCDKPSNSINIHKCLNEWVICAIGRPQMMNCIAIRVKTKVIRFSLLHININNIKTIKLFIDFFFNRLRIYKFSFMEIMAILPLLETLEKKDFLK